IEKVNIQPFIDHLPGKKDTTEFSTENASGSTSQAANVMEALEAQTSLLLIDEDTSATNFLIRDGRMQKLIAPEKEPITPFSNKVKPLYEDY
ncbi:ABC-ATPase domain-containing protein, partial [Escherichia coli]|uniref:P-loop domain-containing protein n=1 Tax=Escherichia coli TaxID=562 RepID=UPI00285F56E5